MSAQSIRAVKVDFHWEEQRLVVQLDGPCRRSRNQDERTADHALEAAGYRVLHITEREFEEEPDRIATLLRRELEAGENRQPPSQRS